MQLSPLIGLFQIFKPIMTYIFKKKENKHYETLHPKSFLSTTGDLQVDTGKAMKET